MEAPLRPASPPEDSGLRQELQRREATTRCLIDSNIIGIVTWNLDGRIVEANDAFLAIIGYGREDLVAGRIRWTDLTPPEWRNRDERLWLPELARSGSVQPFEKEYVRQDGSRVPVLIGAATFARDAREGVAFVLDLTERKRADEQHRAHLHFLESLGRIDRAIQSANDLEQMIGKVLEVILEVFDGDRALLTASTGEPGTTSCTMLAGRERSRRAGSAAPGGLHTDEDFSAMSAELEPAGGPVQYVRDSAPAPHAALLARLGIESALTMPITPRLAGQDVAAYQLTLCQSSHPRVWSPPEVRLFQEIGLRLGDAMATLSMLRHLRRSEAYLAEAQRLTHTGSWALNPLAQKGIYWSDETYRILGLDPDRGPAVREQYLRMVHPDDRDRYDRVVESAFRQRVDVSLEYRVVLADGTVKHLHQIGHPVVDAAGHLVEYVGTVVDVTQQKRAEEERREYLNFLECLDRINRVVQGTSDLERMMSDVLEAVLDIFGADRAWLAHPCEPAAASVRVVMEHTRPRYPGAFAAGTELQMFPELAAMLRLARATGGAVLFGPGCTHQIPARIAEGFSVQSQLIMALYPMGEAPYLFGLHQCAEPRAWTGQDQFLFEAIGHRLTDALTSVLMLRSLRLSEARLDEAQRIAHVGHWERDLATDRMTLSQEGCRIFGLPPELHVLERQQWHDRCLALIHPDDGQRIDAAAAEALSGGARYEVEYRVVRGADDVRIIRSVGEVTRDEAGRPRRMFGTMHDVTELRQAESELRASEARFRTFVDFAADAIWIHSDDATIIDVNQQACEMLGYARDELIGMTALQFDADHDLATFLAVVERVRAGETVTFETHHRRKDGTILPVEVRSRRFVHDGRRFGISAVRDITERQRAEAELRQSRAALAHRQRVSMLGEMAASLTHEVKQPIAAAMIDATACLRSLAPDRLDLAAASRAASRMLQEATWADEIITRTRALFQGGASHREPVDVNAVIQELVVLARQEAAPYAIIIRTALEDALPDVTGDRVQLQQVLMNLMLNAIEAMKDGGGELVVTSRVADDGKVQVSVSDTGIGVPPDRLEQIFEPFVTTKPEGTGMGLAITRSIVESHGGRLWASPNDGPGAIFHFTVPAADGVRATSPPS